MCVRGVCSTKCVPESVCEVCVLTQCLRESVLQREVLKRVVR